MVTWDNFLRGITLIFYFKPTSASFYFSSEIRTILHTAQGQPWPDWTQCSRLCFHAAFMSLVLRVTFICWTFLCHKLTTYSLHQWRSLSHQWMNRLPLSCHDSFLCPTSSHNESPCSLISFLWHLFTAVLYCGYLDICVVKRGPSPRGDDLGFTLFQIS